MNRLHDVFLLLAILGPATLLFDEPALAQCSAHDVMRRQPEFAETLAVATAPKPIESAAAAKVWKSIQIGNFADKRALYGALEDADCGIGDTAEEMLVAPQFTLNHAAGKLDLAVVSVSALGLARENVALNDIYARAQKLGFALCPPEVGPQLRLQYFEQPIGEFLDIAMAPIRTRDGSSGMFSIGNGGAGLLLIGDTVSADTEFYQLSRFVFVRPIDAKLPNAPIVSANNPSRPPASH